MLSLPPAVRIFVARGPTDLRKSFDTLCALVEQLLRQDPFSGHLFVFFNRRRDRVKMLVWERGGPSLPMTVRQSGSGSLL